MPSNLRVLIVRFSALGDVVLTTSLLAALRARHPQLRVTYVTKARYASLLAGSPGVEVVGLEEGESVAELCHRLSPPRFSTGMDLHRSWRSILMRRHVRPDSGWHTVRKPRLARARAVWITGRGPGTDHAVMRYLETARSLDIQERPAAPILFTPPDPAAAALLADLPHPVALAPGAAHWSKRWPSDRWQALADTLRRLGKTPVAVGRPQDVAVFPPGTVVDTSHLSLTGCVDVVRRSRVLVANDSGLLHVATATGTARIALMGPTTPDQGFAPTGPGVRILERRLPCRPCSTLGGGDCPAGHHRCLRDTTPASVAEAVQELAA